MNSPDWKGQTVVVIGSGPSLEPEDCMLVEEAGLTTIAVNSSWKMARFCDVIYAGDADWWKYNMGDIDIPAARWSCLGINRQKYGVNVNMRASKVLNSGMRAIEFAISRGASKVILLGFDCSTAKGSHWHGDHEKTKNPDEASVQAWHKQFNVVDILARQKQVEIINCSRYTELENFPVMSIREALDGNR